MQDKNHCSYAVRESGKRLSENETQLEQQLNQRKYYATGPTNLVLGFKKIEEVFSVIQRDDKVALCVRSQRKAH